jgi:hypothetical protein
MSRFLPKLFIDYSSFWLGALLAIILIYLYFKFRPGIISSIQQFGSKVLGFRDRLSIASESDYQNLLYKYVQGLHILSDFSPLIDISITPQCIAPPPSLVPGEENIDPSLIQQTLGYDPYLSILAAEYNVPQITLADALERNASLLLVGFPGTGKTTAIADCIHTILKSSATDSVLGQKIPFYTKAHFLLAQFPGSDLLDIILAAIQCNQTFHTIPGFPKFLTSTINEGNAILFIDDVDLLNHKDTNQLANFLSAVRRNIPKLQLVATATPSNIGYLIKTPLELVSIAPWNNKSKYEILEKFSKFWAQTTLAEAGSAPDESNIRSSLLVVSDNFSTPLEFTLKTWAAFSGEIKGPQSIHAIETYLKRCFPSNTQNSLNALETIALFSLVQEQSSFTRNDIRSWFSNGKANGIEESPDEKITRLTAILQSAHSAGILHRDGADGFYISSPTIGGFLAAKCLKRLNKQKLLAVLNQPDWSLKYETMRFLAAFSSIDNFLDVIRTDQRFMRDIIIQSGFWLKNTVTNSAEEIEILKAITKEIHTNTSYLIKLRLVTMLAISGNPNAKSVFQHLLKSKDIDTRRASALGSGLIQDLAAVPLLIDQLNDSFPASTAACYALGKISSPRSLEAIADSLLHGDELLRRASAESLAQNRSEGHPALREGASREDLLIRYAVVHGLSLINEPWSLDILDRMRIDEDEWVVRDLAQQVYDYHISGLPYIPENRTTPATATWLTSFTKKQEIPDPNPENVLETLLTALDRGTDEEKQASLEMLAKIGESEIIPELVDLFSYSNPDVRQQAMLTAWFCSPQGYVLPSK